MKLDLQNSNLDEIPFMGSGNKLAKKRLSVGSIAIVKDIAGSEYQVTINEFSSGLYKGSTSSGINIDFTKENVFFTLVVSVANKRLNKGCKMLGLRHFAPNFSQAFCAC